MKSGELSKELCQHLAHLAMPTVSAYCPCAHCLHAPGPFGYHAASEYRPCGQFVHFAAPAWEYVPELHPTQATLDASAVHADLRLPAAQLLQPVGSVTVM